MAMLHHNTCQCQCSDGFDQMFVKAATDSVELPETVKQSGESNGSQRAGSLQSSLKLEIASLERRLQEQYYMRGALDNALGHRPSPVTAIPTPIYDLIKEIAALETEVLHLEQYLLVLYRKAFGFGQFSKTLCSFSSLTSRTSHCAEDEFNTKSEHYKLPTHLLHRSISNRVDYRPMENEVPSSCFISSSVKFGAQSREVQGLESHRVDSSLSTEEGRRSAAKPTSLAEHLGASISDHVPESPNRLAEDMVQCMASIYFKLSLVSPLQLGSSSPTSSLSSSSTFSPKNHSDIWSPGSNHEARSDSYQLDESRIVAGPYSSMVEVQNISVDEDRLQYASKMLLNYRSLVQRLKNVNPKMMNDDQKLAFWINVCNSLVMHAFLAYGFPQKHTKRDSLVLKASYDVGGQQINARLIQTSFLKCQIHQPEWSVWSLLSPGRYSIRGSDSHPYGIENPEPLLRFALSSGGYLDPAVRVYTAKRIHQELEVAKKQYIQARVSSHKDKKIVLLPHVLELYARDASLSLSSLVEEICCCALGDQKKEIQRRLHGKTIQSSVAFSSNNSKFRYIIQRGLLKP